MQYIPQITEESCGIAALKMLLAIVQKDDDYLYLNEDETHGPYSYQDLLVIAERYGVTLIGARFEDKADLSYLTEFPMILTTVKQNEMAHAVLLSERKGKRVKVHDPGKGVYWQKISDLIRDWDGTALAVNHVEKHTIKKTVIDTKDLKGELVSYLLQTLIAVFIAIGTFFMKPDGSPLWPLIFIALSLITEIGLRTALLKKMQRCDKYLRRFYIFIHPDDYFEFYRRGQEYKKSSLTMTLNFIFYLLVVVLIITISLINSFYFLILIATALLTAYLDVFFFTPYKRKIAKDLEVEEQALIKEKNLEGLELKVKPMEVRAYRYAYLEIANKIITITFMILASLVVSIIEKTFFLTNIVFYTCVSLLLYQSLIPLFSFDYRLADNLLNKARVNNLIHHLDENNSKKR